MARYETEFFSVDDDQQQLETAIAELVAVGDGWINLEPKVDEDSRVEVSGFFAWFSARGPRVPVGTFVAGNDRDAASVGLAHGSGRGAGDRLCQPAHHRGLFHHDHLGLCPDAVFSGRIVGGIRRR